MSIESGKNGTDVKALIMIAWPVFILVYGFSIVIEGFFKLGEWIGKSWKEKKRNDR